MCFSKWRSRLVALSLAAPILLVSAASVGAYPDKPIRMIVPFEPGGTAGTLSRLVADSAGEILGRPIIVETKSGAGGVIAAKYVAKSDPDGYTFMMTSAGILSVNPVLYRSKPYDSLKDFTPLAVAMSTPLVLVVATESPLQSVKNLIEVEKKQPGTLSYGSSGIGTSQHLAGVLFNDITGAELVHVPYKGGAAAINDLLGGHIDMMFVQLPSALHHIKSGKLRALAIGTTERNPVLPDLPTMQELGLKGYESSTWTGFMMPSGTDPEIAKTLSDAIIGALNKNLQTFTEMNETVVAGPPSMMENLTRSDIEKWQRILEKVNLAGIQGSPE